MDPARRLGIVGNPPWSQHRRFLAHALPLATHVAFLSTLNHLWTRVRRRVVREAGFGLARIIEIPPPPGVAAERAFSWAWWC